MVALSATGELLAAIARARSVELRAYVLRPGRVLDALESAAHRGAHIVVRLECAPFGDPSAGLADGNANAAHLLAAAGADAQLVDCDGSQPSHMKEARVDGQVYLDDRNWPDDGRDTILRVSPGEPFATQKDEALRREARTIYQAADRGESVDVESESFGFGRIYAAIKYAVAKVPVRLLVAQRDVTARSLPALERMQAAGVVVRSGPDDEKFALSEREGWAGSANASAGVPNQSDWGLRIFDRPLVERLRARFERNWSEATPLSSAETALAHSRS